MLVHRIPTKNYKNMDDYLDLDKNLCYALDSSIWYSLLKLVRLRAYHEQSLYRSRKTFLDSQIV